MTLVVGGVGVLGVTATILQRTYADRRAEWWRRAAWAVDHTLSDNTDAQVLGFDVMAKLQTSPLVTKTEADVFSSWGRTRLFDHRTRDNASDQNDNDRQEGT
ncbi:hypothetical protein QNM97_21045 [Gordonia sp. L191]|uniref:hypothetical protein n=1 Tax=Gordonia sp. L191 TaxID=2982699 RepID=UPI0024BFAFDC|nr:hypothetical protein [Gordonia sp. L191]WHU46449.1 hypothetical protein QNM97_21045 [Gordonia sp. L191]